MAELLYFIFNRDIVLYKSNNICIYENNYETTEYNYFNNFLTGLKWQCVELARRYLIINHNITFPEVDNAYQIFDLDYFYDLNNNKVRIEKCKQGSRILPKKGSLLIWDPATSDPRQQDLATPGPRQQDHNMNKTGHVAVIVKVNSDNIVIIEQNWKENSKKRRLKFINNIIQDSNIIGWINLL